MKVCEVGLFNTCLALLKALIEVSVRLMLTFLLLVLLSLQCHAKKEFTIFLNLCSPSTFVKVYNCFFGVHKFQKLGKMRAVSPFSLCSIMKNGE